MRYVAKIHILDTMEEVVVSGYVYDADPLSDPDHEPLEFTYVSMGKGIDDKITWLRWHVYDALQKAAPPSPRGQ